MYKKIVAMIVCMVIILNLGIPSSLWAKVTIGGVEGGKLILEYDVEPDCTVDKWGYMPVQINYRMINKSGSSNKWYKLDIGVEARQEDGTFKDIEGFTGTGVEVGHSSYVSKKYPEGVNALRLTFKWYYSNSSYKPNPSSGLWHWDGSHQIVVDITGHGEVHDEIVRILEIQPSDTSELEGKEKQIAGQLGVCTQSVKLDFAPITLFNAQREVINGKYDIIYIGNKGTYKLKEAVSDPAKWSFFEYYSTSYYSAVDITHLKATELSKFIQSGQMVYVDETIFNGEQTNLITYLKEYRNNTVDNVIVGPTLLQNNSISELGNRYQTVASKRLQVTLLEGNRLTNNSLTVPFKAINPNDIEGNMSAKLYIDINGDGLYKSDEVFDSLNHIKNNVPLILSTQIPEGFVGQLAWKIEVGNQMVNGYVLGEDIVEAESEDNRMIVKVLQIKPNGNKFSIQTNLADLLEQEVVRKNYNITIDELFTWEYNAKCDADQNYLINMQYDMVILGFADSFGEDKNINIQGYEALKAFIDSKQSVMFTHDTMSSINWVGTELLRFNTDLEQLLTQTDPTLKDEQADWKGGTKYVVESNAGQITQYPYNLEEGERKYGLPSINVGLTHPQYYKVNLENLDVVVWYTLSRENQYGLENKNNPYDPENYYYTYSVGNLTFSGTGHFSDGNSVPLSERQLFVNTIIKASNSANHKPTIKFTEVDETIDLTRNYENIEEMNVADQSNAQKILSDAPSFRFGVSADDIDYADKTIKNLEVTIYQGKRGTDQFVPVVTLLEEEVNKGEIRYLTIEKEILDKFKINEPIYIYTKAQDHSGAATEKMTAIKKTDLPLVVENTSDKVGYLIGDTVNMLTTVTGNVEDYSVINKLDLLTAGTKPSNKGKAVLTAGDNYTTTLYENQIIGTGFSGNLVHNGKLNWQGQYTFKAEEAGNYKCISNMEYQFKMQEDKLQTITAIGGMEVPVRKGSIQVIFKDESGTPIEGGQVQIIGAKAMSGTSNALGVYTNTEAVPTGQYTINATLPEGSKYTIASISKQKVELDYDNPNAVITVTCSLEAPVSIIDFTLVDAGNNETTDLSITDLTTVGKTIKGIIKFSNATELESEKIHLSVNNNQLNFVENERIDVKYGLHSRDTLILKTDLFKISSGGVISSKETLEEGYYEIEFEIQLPANKITKKTTLSIEAVNITLKGNINRNISGGTISATLEVMPQLLDIG